MNEQESERKGKDQEEMTLLPIAENEQEMILLAVVLNPAAVHHEANETAKVEKSKQIQSLQAKAGELQHRAHIIAASLPPKCNNEGEDEDPSAVSDPIVESELESVWLKQMMMKKSEKRKKKNRDQEHVVAQVEECRLNQRMRRGPFSPIHLDRHSKPNNVTDKQKGDVRGERAWEKRKEQSGQQNQSGTRGRQAKMQQKKE